MAEHRSIDEVMGGRDVAPDTADTAGSAGGLTTADMASAGGANATATRSQTIDQVSEVETRDEPRSASAARASTQSTDSPLAPAGDPPRAGTADATPGPDRPSNARPARAEAPNAAGSNGQEQGQAPLFVADRAESLRSRWLDVQTGFVDEPRRAVEQADALVAEVMQQLAKTFADERANLENQWSHGEDISTEDLRMALRRYRSFFDRLLSI